MFYQFRAHAVDLQEFQNDLDTQFDTYGDTQPIPIHRMPCALAYAVTSVSPTIFLPGQPHSAALPRDSAFPTSTSGYPIARSSTGDRGGRRRPALAARTSTGHRRSYPLTRDQVTADTQDQPRLAPPRIRLLPAPPTRCDGPTTAVSPRLEQQRLTANEACTQRLRDHLRMLD